MAITSAFQADDAGSIPAVRSIFKCFLVRIFKYDSLLVQLVERRTVNPYVTGSSPVEGATLI